jgi:hypothetical protein
MLHREFHHDRPLPALAPPATKRPFNPVASDLILRVAAP